MMQDTTPDLIKPIIAAAGFLGSLITLSAMPELTKRQMILAVISGIAFAFWGTPIITAWIFTTNSASWLPTGGSVEGLVGLLLGMGGIHLVAMFNTFSENFAKDPVSFFKNLINKQGNR